MDGRPRPCYIRTCVRSDGADKLPLRKAGDHPMDVPLILVLAAAAIAAWALLFRGMDQALPSRTRELRNRLGSGAEARPQRERAPAGRPPLHPALVLALLLAVLAVGILIGQERQGLGATQEPTAEVSGESAGAGGGEDTGDSGGSGDGGSGEDADKGADESADKDD